MVDLVVGETYPTGQDLDYECLTYIRPLYGNKLLFENTLGKHVAYDRELVVPSIMIGLYYQK